MNGMLILLVGATLLAAACFIIGVAVGRFLLVRRNMGEALVANALAQLSCHHVRVASATVRRRKKPAARVSAVFARGRRLAARAGNSARVSRYRQPRRLACNSKGSTGADVRALPWHGAEGR